MAEARETMAVDVLFVGAGVASLSAAYRLKKRLKALRAQAQATGKAAPDGTTIMVVDKGKAVGSHALSGAVVDPVALRELFPATKVGDLPFVGPVRDEQVMFLTPRGKIRVPAVLLPREMRHEGGYLASIGEMCRWLAKKCEEEGIDVVTEFAANELIRDGRKVVGAKIADKGLAHDGKPGPRFAAGVDLFAKVTVLGEGTRGFLARKLIEEDRLASASNPQVWAVGLKELIEIPAGRVRQGMVIHTFGYPLDLWTYGGSFIYALSDTLLALGLVFGLDYRDPMLESHRLLLLLKAHPTVAELIAGGRVVEYGAKSLPEGGYFALPRLAVDGAVLLGDSAGFLNCMRLKGVHLAMKSGILAADRIADALAANDLSASRLDYRADFEASWAGAEMRRARNFRQGFHYVGLLSGMPLAGLHMVSNGGLPAGRMTMPPDFRSLRNAAKGRPTPKVKTDTSLYLDLQTDVFKSGTIHREDQPPHCHILDAQTCVRCREEYAMPCTRFCPAKVYEEKLDSDGRFLGIQVSFANCVHCKTCEIKDPLENLQWVPPEGGDGPRYKMM